MLHYVFCRIGHNELKSRLCFRQTSSFIHKMAKLHFRVNSLGSTNNADASCWVHWKAFPTSNNRTIKLISLNSCSKMFYIFLKKLHNCLSSNWQHRKLVSNSDAVNRTREKWNLWVHRTFQRACNTSLHECCSLAPLFAHTSCQCQSPANHKLFN